MRALIIKEFRELMRDRRTLAMLIAMPVLLLIIFGYAANFSVDKISVTVIGAEAQSLARDIRGYDAAKDGIDIVTIDASQSGASDAERILRDRGSDAVIVATEAADADDSEDASLSNRMKVYVDGTSLFSAQTAKRTVLQLVAENTQDRVDEVKAGIEQTEEHSADFQTALAQYTKQLQQFRDAIQPAIASGQPLPAVPTPPQVPSASAMPSITVPSADSDGMVKVLFNPDLKTSWVMVPGLIGLILTLIGTVVTSIGLVRERETGTLEQLAVMPIKPGAVIMGKIVPYFLLALIDMALITGLGMWLFGVPFVGNAGIFLLAAVLFLFVVLGLGVLISSLSQTTGQAIQMALMITMPQILLSGLIFPLESMAAGVRWIGYLLPLTWFNIASQGVMLRGASLSSLWMPLVVLTAEAVVIFGASTLRMRRMLTHGGAR
jgi:ABC-2 type transport system permease protein